MLHERVLLRCIMKMDHHCPWINNCCGHQNHASFTLFLLLAPLGCIHAAFIFVMTMYTQLYNRVSGHRDTLPFLSDSVMSPMYWRSPFQKYTFCDLASTTACLISSISSFFQKALCLGNEERLFYSGNSPFIIIIFPYSWFITFLTWWFWYFLSVPFSFCNRLSFLCSFGPWCKCAPKINTLNQKQFELTFGHSAMRESSEVVHI